MAACNVWLAFTIATAVVVAVLLTALVREHQHSSHVVVWLSDLHALPFYSELLGPSCKCFSYGPYQCAAGGSGALPFPYDGDECLATATGNPYGTFGCDGPWRLVASATEDARARHPGPAAVLVTGDYVAHQSCQFPVTDPVLEGARIVHAATRLVAQAFEPHVPHVRHTTPLVTTPLGNDDYVPDYSLPNVTDGTLGLPHPYLELVAAGLEPPLTPAQHDRFVRGGGVAYPLGALGVWVALNTVIYSPDHAALDGPAGEDPFGQFAWLEGVLARAARRGKGVVITGHIPPTVDQYSFTLEWQQRYALRYAEVVGRHAGAVRAQLFGHTHQNMLRAFPRLPDGPEDGPPLLVSAAVTPVYNNNPTWRALTLDRHGAVSDFTVIAANLSAVAGGRPLQWEALYTASERYAPYDALSSAGMMANDTLYEAYLFDRVSGAPGWDDAGAAANLRSQLACGISDGFVQADFDACVEAGGPSAPGVDDDEGQEP